MAHESCVFCSIIQKRIPASIVYEADDVLVIKDIAPKAPVHYLIIPKKHIHDISACTPDEATLLGDMLLVAKKLASHLSGSQAFRLIVNNGADVGQSVFHLHMHFLSGKKMTDF